MTTAQKGLAKALGRSASGDVIALAEMSTTDLLASMSDEHKAEMAAKLAAEAPPAPAAGAEDMPPKKKDGCSEDGDEDDADGEDGEYGEGKKKPKAAASDDRIKAVAAAVENDENCKGKAALALQMLADDDFAGLSASGLVKLLGKTPATASVSNGDDAALSEMRNALAGTQNSNLDPAGSVAVDTKVNTTAIWDAAIARVCPAARK